MALSRIIKKLRYYRNNEDISIKELYNFIKINEQAMLLDVRSPQEYAEGHLDRSNEYTTV